MRIYKTDVEQAFQEVLLQVPICSPLELTKRREALNLTQPQAARLCCVKVRTWRAWEYGVNPMPEANWRLFLLQIEAWEKFWDKKQKWRTAGESKNEVEDDWG